jgi:hypothetical protein
MFITSMNKCLLRTILEAPFAFTRHIRQTLSVTEPRNTGFCKRLLTVICKPGLHRACWHCTLCYLALPGHEGRNCPADKNEPNRLEP